jgi:hypothetical protein
MYRTVLAAAAAFGIALAGLTAAPALAEPPPWLNPHYPDQQHNNCAGGQGGAFHFGWCDGEHYPDGSYWHQITTDDGWGATPECVIDSGGQVPAPPGGCEGAVKG